MSGADIERVRQGIGSDSCIGFSFNFVSFGGSRFLKDVRALTRTAIEAGAKSTLTQAVEMVNDRQKDVLFKKSTRFFGKNVSGMTVTLWGSPLNPTPTTCARRRAAAFLTRRGPRGCVRGRMNPFRCAKPSSVTRSLVPRASSSSVHRPWRRSRVLRRLLR